MRLYYAPGTISIAVAITLHEAGLDFEPVRISFSEAQQTKAEYLAINPKGRVPTLEVGGRHLTETGALLNYIASRAPAAKLVPDDLLEQAHMQGVMYFLASTMHVNHAHKARGMRWATQPESHADMTAKVAQNMRDNADYVARHCLRGDYVLGDRFSIADPYVFVVCSWLKGDGVPPGEFPAIAAYLDRMRARPSVERVTAEGMLRV